MEVHQQQDLLGNKYGAGLVACFRLNYRKPRGTKKYFDSGDYNMMKQGKGILPDSYLDYSAPIDTLPVKSTPTERREHTRTHLDATYRGCDQIQDVGPVVRTVVDY